MRYAQTSKQPGKVSIQNNEWTQQSPAVLNLYLEKRMCMNNVNKFSTAKSLFIG